MLHHIIDLYQYFNIEKKKGARAEITSYIHDGDLSNKPTILVIPGGAYTHIGERETDAVAKKFFERGFNSLVLRYSLVPITFPTQLIEGLMAVSYAKEILKNKVVTVGFSAGGHLACSLATLNHLDCVKEVLGDRDCKPNASILAYPVIVSDNDYISDSIKGVSNGDKKVIELLSLEKSITSQTPPAFIWTTANDQGVPSENSIKLALALKEKNVEFELHIFQRGVHGLSLATMETAPKGLEEKFCLNDVAKWFDMAVDFINRNFKE